MLPTLAILNGRVDLGQDGFRELGRYAFPGLPAHQYCHQHPCPLIMILRVTLSRYRKQDEV